MPRSPDKFGDPLHACPATTSSVGNLRPESRGSIHIRSGDFRDAPLIKPGYLSTPGDRQVAAQAIRLTRRICKAPALARFKPVEHKPGAEIDSDEALRSEEHTSELQSLMRNSYAVFCLKKKKEKQHIYRIN